MLQVQEAFGFAKMYKAVRLHQRASDMLHKGFEWTLMNGEPCLLRGRCVFCVELVSMCLLQSVLSGVCAILLSCSEGVSRQAFTGVHIRLHIYCLLYTSDAADE